MRGAGSRLSVQVRGALLALMAAATLGAGALPAASQTPGATPSFVSLANRLSPGVVNIDVVKRVQRRIPDLFGGPEGSTATRVQRGVGSGFIIDPSGLIVTNNHVVQGQSELTITLWNGRTYRGRVLGTDPLTDVALVKIPATHLFSLPLGNSNLAQVGEWVLAFGSPLGLRRTVTHGIISATNREVSINERVSFLQTDAAINPGNSGGPLVDMAGRVIGINTAIAAEAQGIGFAIPINSLKLVLDDLRTHGHVTRAWLGISFAEITPDLQEQFPELKGKHGLVVAQVVPDGPASRAGLRAEDVIVAVDGHPVTATHDLIDRMAKYKPGDHVSLTYTRNGTRHTTTLTLQTMPPAAAQAPEEP